MKKEQGFTLTELLVAIVIMGILGGIILSSGAGALRAARNSQRKSDLARIQSSLQQYYTDHGFYPTGGKNGLSVNPFKATPGTTLDNCIGQPGPCTATRVYLQSFPEDPAYKYGGPSGDCRHYCYVAYKSLASAGTAAQRNPSNCPTNASGDRCQYYELSATTEPNSLSSCTIQPGSILHECDTGAHVGNYVLTPLGELKMP